MRGWVCNLPGLASAVIFGPESGRIHDLILLSQICTSPRPGRSRPCIYIPQEHVCPVISSGTVLSLRRLLRLKSKPKLHYDRRSDGQSVLVSGIHLVPRPILLLLSLIIFRQLRICLFGVPFLTRSRVCSFQFFLVIASADFLRSESHGIHEPILLSLFVRLLQPGRPGSCIYFSQEQGSPVFTPEIGFHPHGWTSRSAFINNVYASYSNERDQWMYFVATAIYSHWELAQCNIVS
jgi:hypothetical protein